MITSGTILMERDTLRPPCFEIEEEPYPNDWTSVRHHLTSPQLEHELTSAGWTFFYMAGSISASAFGLDPAKMMHTALKRLIRNAQLQKCNSLEIDGVTTDSFFGMPYVSVSGHPRHIQRGLVFSGQ